MPAAGGLGAHQQELTLGLGFRQNPERQTGRGRKNAPRAMWAARYSVISVGIPVRLSGLVFVPVSGRQGIPSLGRTGRQDFRAAPMLEQTQDVSFCVGRLPRGYSGRHSSLSTSRAPPFLPFTLACRPVIFGLPGLLESPQGHTRGMSCDECPQLGYAGIRRFGCADEIRGTSRAPDRAPGRCVTPLPCPVLAACSWNFHSESVFLVPNWLFSFFGLDRHTPICYSFPLLHHNI